MLFCFRGSLQNEVECGAIYQSPKDPKEFQIIGINASSLDEYICSNRETLGGFSISTKDILDPRHLREYVGHYTFGVTKHKVDEFSDEFPEVASVKCELVVEGKTKEVCHPRKAHYVVAPAHFVLTSNECEDMMRKVGPIDICAMRGRKVKEAKDFRYSFDLHNFPKKNDLEHSNPIFVYTHYLPADEPDDGYNAISRDVALIEIQHWQLQGEQQPGVPQKTIEQAMKEKNRAIFYDGKLKKFSEPIGPIFPLQRASTLERMGELGVIVMVGGDTYTGYMVSCGHPIASNGRKWTRSIQFVSETQ